MIYTSNAFESVNCKPPTRSDYYLAYLEDETIQILYYSVRHNTWTTENISSDSAFSKCFNRKVIAYAPLTATKLALHNHKWE